MRNAELIGVVLLVIGLAILFLLRDTLVRLIIFVLEFLGVLLGVFLVVVGLVLLLGGRWVWGYREINALLTVEASSRTSNYISRVTGF